jgi:DNA-binding transcriptional LysR family regulator
MLGNAMELRDMEYFAVLARHGNVRRASEALDLTPGALSKSLHRLEQELHTKLFERTPKGVELTAVGTALLSRVQHLRTSFDDIAKEAADLAGGRGGHLRIGTTPIESDYVAAAYSALLKEAPKVTLQLVAAENDITIPALRKGDLDMVFTFAGSPGEEISQEIVMEDEHVVCASTDHRLAKLKRAIPLSELVLERWVLPSRTSNLAQNLMRRLVEKGLPEPRIAFEASSIRTRMLVLASSELIGITSRRAVARAARYFKVAPLRIPELTWPRRIAVLSRKNAYVSAAAQRLIELFRLEMRRPA